MPDSTQNVSFVSQPLVASIQSSIASLQVTQAQGVVSEIAAVQAPFSIANI